MDLQPSGKSKEEILKKEELLYFETDKIYFTIKGKNRNSEIKEGETDSEGFKITYEEDNINLRLHTKKAYFFEYENYELIIEKKDKDIDISFYHANRIYEIK